MKQHITIKQWNEIGLSAQLELRKFFKAGKYGWMKLSIGQMIEFLIENGELDGDEDGRPALPVYEAWEGKESVICDALWQPVKEILNK